MQVLLQGFSISFHIYRYKDNFIVIATRRLKAAVIGTTINPDRVTQSMFQGTC